MPCTDGGYSGDAGNQLNAYKKRCDLLARIACAALTELEDNEIAEALLLRDDEVREWWEAHKEFDRKRKAEEEAERQRVLEKARLKKIRKELIAKLSPDERRALGL